MLVSNVVKALFIICMLALRAVSEVFVAAQRFQVKLSTYVLKPCCISYCTIRLQRRQDKKFIKIWQPKAGLVQYIVQ